MRVFPDANVPFSAAYLPTSRLSELWSLANVQLVTSRHAVEEARGNLRQHRPHRLAELDRLLAGVHVSDRQPQRPIDVELDAKDWPILSAAIGEECDVLLTGDKRHFGPLYGRTVAGVTVLAPAAFLRDATRPFSPE
jgi:predicted nucleic acid-binding protein